MQMLGISTLVRNSLNRFKKAKFSSTYLMPVISGVADSSDYIIQIFCRYIAKNEIMGVNDSP